MSNNIKLNPTFPQEKFITDGFNAIIAAIPTPSPGVPNVEDLAGLVTDYCSTIAFNASVITELDQVSIYGLVADVINSMTADSWCADCCDNTFDSYKHMTTEIQMLGIYTDNQLQYVNQILGMVCNPNVNVTISEITQLLNTLQTSVLVDNNMSAIEKVAVLNLISISKAASKYWISNISGSWVAYAGAIPVDQIRSFWISTLLGSILSLNYVSNNNINSIYAIQVIQGLVGALSGGASYAILR